MKVINITQRGLRKKRELYVSSKVVNTEAKLYLHDEKVNYNYIREVLKIFYNQSNGYLADKISTITQINALFEDTDFKELVLPDGLVSINGNLAGFSMPLIEDNINLALLLKNPRLSLGIKLKILKQIQALISKINANPNLRDRFFLGDVHEANFIWDINDQMIKAVDLDSAYVTGGSIPTMKYVTHNSNLNDIPNKFSTDERTGMIIPNQNTVNFCFMIMLLNALSGEDIYLFDKEMYYSYLGYLGKKKFPKEILDILVSLYTPGHIELYDPDILDRIDTSKDYVLKRVKN